MARKKQTAPVFEPLSDATLGLLREFATEHGARWKHEIGMMWMRGDVRLPTDLYRLRNSHGPTWLATFELGA